MYLQKHKLHVTHMCMFTVHKGVLWTFQRFWSDADKNIGKVLDLSRSGSTTRNAPLCLSF